MSRAYMESMAQSGEQIPPAVKAWLDNVLVPAIIEQWVAAVRSGVYGVDSGAESHDAEPQTAKLKVTEPGRQGRRTWPGY